jgi:hypothetical protein
VKGIDGKSVSSPSNDGRMLAVLETKTLHQADRETVVMVIPIGLDMGVVLIKAQRDGSSEGFVALIRTAHPSLDRSRLHENAIKGNSENAESTIGLRSVQIGDLFRFLGKQWNANIVGLLANFIGIVSVRKTPHKVIRHAVGFDFPDISILSNFHLTFFGWLSVCFNQIQFLRFRRGVFPPCRAAMSTGTAWTFRRSAFPLITCSGEANSADQGDNKK